MLEEAVGVVFKWAGDVEGKGFLDNGADGLVGEGEGDRDGDEEGRGE